MSLIMMAHKAITGALATPGAQPHDPQHEHRVDVHHDDRDLGAGGLHCREVAQDLEAEQRPAQQREAERPRRAPDPARPPGEYQDDNGSEETAQRHQHRRVQPGPIRQDRDRGSARRPPPTRRRTPRQLLHATGLPTSSGCLGVWSLSAQSQRLRGQRLREITRHMMSEVPSSISSSLTSRIHCATGIQVSTRRSAPGARGSGPSTPSNYGREHPVRATSGISTKCLITQSDISPLRTRSPALMQHVPNLYDRTLRPLPSRYRSGTFFGTNMVH